MYIIYTCVICSYSILVGWRRHILKIYGKKTLETLEKNDVLRTLYNDDEGVPCNSIEKKYIHVSSPYRNH